MVEGPPCPHCLLPKKEGFRCPNCGYSTTVNGENWEEKMDALDREAFNSQLQNPSELLADAFSSVIGAKRGVSNDQRSDEIEFPPGKPEDIVRYSTWSREHRKRRIVLTVLTTTNTPDGDGGPHAQCLDKGTQKIRWISFATLLKYYHQIP